MFSVNISTQYILPLSVLMVKIVRFIAVFYFMSLVVPEDFVKWVLISLILQYSLFLQLGVPAPTSRELSIAYGKGDLKKVLHFSTLSIQIFLIASLALYLFINFFYLEENGYKVFWYVTTSHGSALLVMQARATFQNYKVIISQCLECLIICIGLFYLDSSNPLESLINIYLIAAILTCLICFPSLKISGLVLKLYRVFSKEIIELLKFSLPLLMFTFFMLFKSTWDILAINYYEIKNSSLYVSSNILSDCIRILSSLLSMVFVPYMAKKYGECDESISVDLLLELKRYQFFSILTFVLITLALYPTLYFGINYYYPEYINVIDIFFIRTVAVLIGILSLPRLLFLTTIRQTHVVNLIMVACILVGLFLTIFLKSFFDIFYTMTLSILMSNLLCYVITNIYTKKVIDKQQFS